MVFIILVGAALFSLVFRGYGGDEIVAHFLTNIEGGVVVSIIITMTAIFILGFFLEVFEIIYVVVPIIGPAILMMGVDPLWLGIMIAINLQTSFLTPPFGFALFYLRGAPLCKNNTNLLWSYTICDNSVANAIYIMAFPRIGYLSTQSNLQLVFLGIFL